VAVVAAPRFLTERLRAEARAKTALAPAKGRGVGGSKAGRTGGVKAKKVKARTVYLPDDLFERVWIQAHRKGITISEYVTWALGRQVPGPRSMRDVDDTAA